MDQDVFAGLNPAQREAVGAVRGPVCILAGAGTGKTTAITRRIAHQVRSGTFRPAEILPVTFTDKAAGEMRARLGLLGVEGVRARTFHAAALAQLHALAEASPGEVLPSKALLLRQIGNGLPGAYRFRPASDLATEIEWAKNRRIPPERYLEALQGHEPPIPVDLVLRVYRDYERRKGARGLVDFEDLLELAIRMYETQERAVERFRARYAAFTVDEYQDANALQQALLERWLGDRDELCVVGDDYQSIYGFTGASPEHLLELPKRYPRACVVRLEENYRSSPQVLELANGLVPRLGGARKTLRATRPDGPAPTVRPFASAEAETAWVVSEIHELHRDGVPLEEIAVLYRTNARSAEYELALGDADIPYQVRDGAFLERQAARRALQAIGRGEETDVLARVRHAALAQGLLDEAPDGLGDQELVRQADLRRLVSLAEAFEDGARTLADFVTDLRSRFGSEVRPRGVQLSTYHRAKGLEFDAVFLPRLEERELPSRQAKTPAAISEERRLLYVGITRARRHLALTWSGRPSRFLDEVAPLAVTQRPQHAPRAVSADDPVLMRLRTWRKERAKADGVPAYVVFHDRTLEAIADIRPANRMELASIPGIGPTKLDRYGDALLAAVSATVAA